SPKDNREKIDIDEIVRIFDLKNVGRSSATFDPDKLDWLNGEYMRELDTTTYWRLALAELERRGVSPQQFPDVYEAIDTSRNKITVFDKLIKYIDGYYKGS